MRCGYRHVLLGRAKELLRVEKRAMMETAGGKLTTEVAVHASVHSNRASGEDRPLATSGLAHPVRIRLCGNTV